MRARFLGMLTVCLVAAVVTAESSHAQPRIITGNDVWVSSLHRKTYAQAGLPFNWKVVLLSKIETMRAVNLPDTNWGCVNCEKFYATIIAGKPSSFGFKYASDNTARMYVNGQMVFEHKFGSANYCTGQPCCTGCCDTPANCRAVMARQGWNHINQQRLDRIFTEGRNVVIWRIRQDGGGSGFDCELSLAGARVVQPRGVGATPSPPQKVQIIDGDDVWVSSLHRTTYAQISLPFNWKVVLLPEIKTMRTVNLPDTNWGCFNCEKFYATIIEGKPSSFAFRYASDNTARMYVNGQMVFEHKFGSANYCTGRPCCTGCCDTPANCKAVMARQNWIHLNQQRVGRLFSQRRNVVIWRVRQDGGGSGFDCELRLAGARVVQPKAVLH